MELLENTQEASARLNELIAAAREALKVETRKVYPGDNGPALTAWYNSESALSLKLTREEMQAWCDTLRSSKAAFKRIHAIEAMPLPDSRSYLAWEIYAAYPCLRGLEDVHLAKWTPDLEEIGDFWLLTFAGGRTALFQWYYNQDGYIEKAELYNPEDTEDWPVIMHRLQLWEWLEERAIPLAL